MLMSFKVFFSSMGIGEVIEKVEYFTSHDHLNIRRHDTDFFEISSSRLLRLDFHFSWNFC